MAEEEQIDDAVDARLCELWAAARQDDCALVDKKRLRNVFRESILSFLRPLALFYSNLTMVPPPEALRGEQITIMGCGLSLYNLTSNASQIFHMDFLNVFIF